MLQLQIRRTTKWIAYTPTCSRSKPVADPELNMEGGALKTITTKKKEVDNGDVGAATLL